MVDGYSLAVEVPILTELIRAFVRYRVEKRYCWIWSASNGTVVSGPFAGLRYVHRSIGSTYSPKLLGTYEKELWAVMEQIILIKYQSIINIGAAEGYYAIGLATRLPSARVICFESATKEHYLLRMLAAWNRVSGQISLQGVCTSRLLRATLRRSAPSLVICDAEGAEIELLDPEIVPALRQADILVELHDLERDGASRMLRCRFAASHSVTVIRSRERLPADWPLAQNISWEEQAEYMAEHRSGPQEWFWMCSHSRSDRQRTK